MSPFPRPAPNRRKLSRTPGAARATATATATAAATAAAIAALAFSAPAASAAPAVFNTGAGATGHTYDVILDSALSWDAARAAAQAAGGDLATIDTLEENNFITALLTNNSAPAGAYWFGLRETTENVYVDITGGQPTFASWAPNEPDNSNGFETVAHVLWTAANDTTVANPAQLARRGQWNDAPNSGYPVTGIVVPPDVLRAGYLVEIAPAVDPRGGGDDDGGGATAIPLPAALYASPLALTFAGLFYRRMRRSA